jgi:hypothetical protein
MIAIKDLRRLTDDQLISAEYEGWYEGWYEGKELCRGEELGALAKVLAERLSVANGEIDRLRKLARSYLLPPTEEGC